MTPAECSECKDGGHDRESIMVRNEPAVGSPAKAREETESQCINVIRGVVLTNDVFSRPVVLWMRINSRPFKDIPQK